MAVMIDDDPTSSNNQSGLLHILPAGRSSAISGFALALTVALLASIPDQALLSAVVDLVEGGEAFLKRVQELYDNPEENDHCDFAQLAGLKLERPDAHPEAGPVDRVTDLR